MVTIARNPPPPGPKLESLTHIDISTFTQSELHALSICSDAAFDLRRTDDVVIPQIDRSVFNESTGSRRQTYSRPRPVSRNLSSAAGRRPRLAGLLPSHKPPPSSSPDRAENKTIVNFLKQLLGENHTSNSPTNFSQSQLIPFSQDVPETIKADTGAQLGLGVQETAIVVHSSGRKRKRERKVKVQENDIGIKLEIVNRNGVAVDLAALANADDLYGAELWRRSDGLGTEEEVLGFLRGLEGQWCSRRKRRKIIDASEFGDALPIGWKLLLGLKRREGRVWVYCRRYVSPSGQHFLSCKEAASYLQSYFGYNDANQPMDQRTGRIQQNYGAASGSHVGIVHKSDDIKHDTISNSTLPSSSISAAHDNEISLMGIDNLAEVQVRDLFECYKCNMTFDEKDLYLEHLLSFHQRTTRRYRLGTSVGEGVIIKDGKYECQFCHKVFEERRSYNGHVGNHVKNYVRNSKESLGQVTVRKSIEFPPPDELPSRISKMDALIEIAQNSILETSNDGPNDKPNSGTSPNRQNVEETGAVNSDHELNSGSHPSEIEDCMADRALDHELSQRDSEYTMTEEKIVKLDGISDVGNDINVVCTNTPEHSKLDEVEKYGNSELEIGFGNSHVNSNHDVAADTITQTVKQNILQSGVTDSSMTPVQLSHHFAAFTAISNKKLDNIMGFEELGLDELEPLSPSLLEASMDFANNAEIEEGFNSSVNFGSEAVMLNMAGKHQLTTVCVWCRTEFNHESIDLEAQSDSIGFMCPTCKAKISGHLESGFSMNSHR